MVQFNYLVITEVFDDTGQADVSPQWHRDVRYWLGKHWLLGEGCAEKSRKILLKRVAVDTDSIFN